MARKETAEDRVARLEAEAIFAQEAAKLREEAARARVLEKHMREQVKMLSCWDVCGGTPLSSVDGCCLKRCDSPVVVVWPRNWCGSMLQGCKTNGGKRCEQQSSRSLKQR